MLSWKVGLDLKHKQVQHALEYFNNNIKFNVKRKDFLPKYGQTTRYYFFPGSLSFLLFRSSAYFIQ